MKHKTYGDNNNEYEFGSGIEIISNSDPISARSVNRPIANLYENEEETYKLLNTLIKTVYGNVNNAILPDIYEDFAPEGFVINSFKNDATKFFLRVPTGMMILNNHKDDPQKNKGNPFSIPGEFDYKESVNKNNFTQDIDKSVVFDNRPNISLLERQLANFVALDLTDLTNDINIHEMEMPMAYNVAVVDPDSKFQLFDAAGSLAYVTDDGGNQLFVCNRENAEYILEDVKYLETDVEYNYKPCGDNNKLGKDFKSEKLRYYYIEKRDPDKKIESFLKKINEIKDVPEGATFLTTEYDNAYIVKDYNGNNKTRIGYYVDVVRATEQDDEITYLPNKKKNASWKVCLPGCGTKEDIGKQEKKYTYVVDILDHNNSPLTKLEFFFYDYASSDLVNNTLFNKILVECEGYFTPHKYQFEIEGTSTLSHGIEILSESSSKNCNNYKLTISYYLDNDYNNKKICETLDESTGYPKNEINNVLPEPAYRQKCYNDIFELTNAFLGKFSSYQVDITNIYNYISGETIIKLPDGGKTVSLYYDLNANYVDNKNNIKYDKSGRLFLDSDTEITDKNLIKLFDFDIDRPSSIGLAPKIRKIKVYPITLDKRSINTKLAEYDTLISNSRTELNNYVVMGDEGRKIEIAEDAPANDKQTRITSPVLRLSTKNVLSSNNPNWTEKGGDEESDFRDSYKSRNFITNDDTINYHDDSDMGIILNDNKGIKIYSNDSRETTGNHSDVSSFKPIEISNKKGNINLLTKDNNSRINIRNINDKETNIIDLLGVTRVRSSSEAPLVIRRIVDGPTGKSEAEDISNLSMPFVSGYSRSEENIGALSNKPGHENDDITVGRINFYYGKDSDNSSNKTNNNRMVSFELADPGTIGKLANQKKLFTGRGAHSGGDKKIFTLFGDAAPSNEMYSLGLPKKSRSFYEINNIIPYSDDRPELKVDKEGNSTEFLGGEGRWLSSFIKYGYFDKVTLSDTEIRNEDKRIGTLRMGNSNIYDVSSIYINYDPTNRKNEGTINFDNRCKNPEDDEAVYENSICSHSENDLKKSSINFILNRRLDSKSYDTSNDIEHNNGLNLVRITNSGTTFAKDVTVNRQLFVNARSGKSDSNATQFDNNSLVVKGQSILNGDLILGLNLDSVAKINTKNYATEDGYTIFSESENKLNPNKLYNEEYGKKGDPNCLYTLRNYGRTYLKGDITLNGKFTESSTFDKKIVINNNAYAGTPYNAKNSILDFNYYTTLKGNKDYDGKEDDTTNRHHTSLDVVSGTIKFGATPSEEEYDVDTSDLKLYGSQWIRRRLEVGNIDGSVLIDTKIYDDRFIVKDNEGINKNADNPLVSPVFYVDGATSLNGDVVFGGGLKDVPNDKWKSKVVKNFRESIEKDPDFNPVKVIFWGDNEITKDEEGNSINDNLLITDFDFHGATWFDNAVRIGGKTDKEYSKSGIGKLIIEGDKETPYPEDKNLLNWRKNKSALDLRGSLSVYGYGYNEINGTRIDLNILNKYNKTISLIKLDKDIDINASENLDFYASSNASLSSTNKLDLSSNGKVSISSSTNKISISNKLGTDIVSSAGSINIISGEEAGLGKTSSSISISNNAPVTEKEVSSSSTNSKISIFTTGSTDLFSSTLDLYVSSSITIGTNEKKPTITVNGNTTIKNGLNIDGAVNITNGGVSASGSITTSSGGVSAPGDIITSKGSLSVNKGANIGGPTKIDSTLYVAENISTDGNLSSKGGSITLNNAKILCKDNKIYFVINKVAPAIESKKAKGGK